MAPVSCVRSVRTSIRTYFCIVVCRTSFIVTFFCDVKSVTFWRAAINNTFPLLSLRGYETVMESARCDFCRTSWVVDVGELFSSIGSPFSRSCFCTRSVGWDNRRSCSGKRSDLCIRYRRTD
eukprot:TRINITY_DN160_c0_g1_i1.p1 TRINITY_DN160_c0_g1~~TRINITY_DN160_c0_g1_i1.p1  ORF type:complete len:122 (-),score=15.39 TRINITY_DN160_c0_g1_i1:237-602(-)